MTVSTTLPGRPGDARAVAGWLRGSLGPGLGDAAGDLGVARSLATTGWQGAAGEAFGQRAERGRSGTEALAGDVATGARSVDGYATALEKAQAGMARIRADAADAGLTVSGDDILPPGDAPPAPVAVGPAATQTAVDAHAVAVRAQETWSRLDAAYDRAAASVRAVDDELNRFLASSFWNVVKDITEKPVLAAADLVGGAGETVAKYHETRLSAEAERLRTQADTVAERVRTAPAGTARELLDQDLADAGRFRAQAGDLDVQAGRIEVEAGRWAVRAGGALAVAGVAWDIAHGKPAEQAIVSGAVGFGASVAMGAAIGTLVPVPVLGTALGAVFGAGVGLFTSGMVDSLYENGPSHLGEALADGAEAVGDAGAAIGDLATEAWDAIF